MTDSLVKRADCFPASAIKGVLILRPIRLVQFLQKDNYKLKTEKSSSLIVGCRWSSPSIFIWRKIRKWKCLFAHSSSVIICPHITFISGPMLHRSDVFPLDLRADINSEVILRYPCTHYYPIHTCIYQFILWHFNVVKCATLSSLSSGNMIQWTTCMVTSIWSKMLLLPRTQARPPPSVRPRPPARARLAHSLFLEDGAIGEGDLESAIQIWDDERHFFHAPV